MELDAQYNSEQLVTDIYGVKLQVEFNFNAPNIQTKPTTKECCAKQTLKLIYILLRMFFPKKLA